MRTEFTPGPWEVKGSRINSEYGTVAITESYGASLEKDGRFGAYKDYKANAHLIAAAPELLEALEFLQTCMVNRSTVEGGLPWTSDVIRAMEKAKAAIAKARGEA